jgi:hypothetical protein
MKPKVLFYFVVAALLCGSCAAPATKSDPQRAALGLGKCVAEVKKDDQGKVIDVIPADGCVKGGGPGSKVQLSVVVTPGNPNRRQPVQAVNEWITFGEGTTTCYGPPIPSPPMCVCTAAPCP